MARAQNCPIAGEIRATCLLNIEETTNADRFSRALWTKRARRGPYPFFIHQQSRVFTLVNHSRVTILMLR